MNKTRCKIWVPAAVAFLAATPIFAEGLANDTRELCASTSQFDMAFKKRLVELGWSPITPDETAQFSRYFLDGVIIATADANSRIDWSAATKQGREFTDAALKAWENGEKVSLFINGDEVHSTLMAMQFPDEHYNVLRCIYSGAVDASTTDLLDSILALDKRVGRTWINSEIDSILMESVKPSENDPNKRLQTSTVVSRYKDTPAGFDREPLAPLGFSVIAATEM